MIRTDKVIVMKKPVHCKLIVLIILLSVRGSAVFAGDWDVRAKLVPEKPGITEAVLLPELLLQRPDKAYDLSLSGPDGRPRSFELYMKEKTGRKEVALLPLKIELTDDGGFIWESKAPEKLLTEIRINIADRDYTGKVHVEGKSSEGWQYIARNQAVYQSSGAARAVIDIRDGRYDTIRLHFISFDNRFKRKIVPIKDVNGVVKATGKDFAYQKIDLTGNIRRSETGGFTELKSLLPGKGINIQSVTLMARVQFQGRWEIGHEIIRHGQSRFVVIKSGNIPYVDSNKQTVTLRIDRKWPAKSLILRLKSGTGYVGEIGSLSIRARLPRMVFLADSQGDYTAYTGAGNRIAIRDYPGDSRRSEDQSAVFVQSERNPLFNTDSFVDKYRIMGGPFNDSGYLWKSNVSISEAGYYTLKFNLTAALDKDYKKVRLVKDGQQIPFFFGRNEDRTIELEKESDYDAENNTSAWILTIPKVSGNWKYLNLVSAGIFKRDVHFYRKKPGNTGWEKMYSRRWQNKTMDETTLRVEFMYLFHNQKQIKIIIDHGDNQPLYINSFKGVYSAPSINFLAHQAGDYSLYGGNRNTSPADYDLSLIQQRLLETLPVEVEMQNMEKRQAEGWGVRFLKQFQAQGWGLYLILGVVTLLLSGIIIRLFPAVEKKQIHHDPDAVKEIENKKQS